MTEAEKKALIDKFKKITIAELYLEVEREAITLRKYISKQLRAGTGAAEIKATLLRDLREGGQIFGSFRSQFKATVKNEVADTNRKVQFQLQREDGVKLYSWTLDPGASHCDDCINRSEMEPMTMKEWEVVGTPDAGMTICGDRCRCRLIADGYFTNAEVEEANQEYLKEKGKK